MAKRMKASCTYLDSLSNDVEILGSTQGSCAPGILHPTTFTSPAKRAEAASSTISNRYNYRDGRDAEDGDEDSVASPPADNYDEDLSDVEVVEKSKPKI